MSSTVEVVLETSGDYELVGPPDGSPGVLVIRCRHCGMPDGGGDPKLVRVWWVSMTGDRTPVHETCKSRPVPTSN